jgi:hypothetical protein
MRDDLILGIAMTLTLGFTAAVFTGNDVLAAWLAGALAIVGIVRLVLIVVEALSPDY